MIHKKHLINALIVTAAVVTGCLYAGVFHGSLDKTTSAQAQDLKVTNFEDSPTFSNITDLTHASTAVFIGTVEGEAGTRNLARDPKDPSKEDPNVYMEGIDYNVKVSAFLKGSDPQSTVLVTEEKQIRDGKDKPFVPAEHFIKLHPGETYIFFTQKSSTSGRYFATGQPFFFAVKDNVAQVNTNEQELLQKFKPTDLSSLIQQIKQAK